MRRTEAGLCPVLFPDDAVCRLAAGHQGAHEAQPGGGEGEDEGDDGGGRGEGQGGSPPGPFGAVAVKEEAQ